MPNIGGPETGRGRIFIEAVHSTILYAAPVWQQVMHKQKYSRIMEKAQRKALLRVVCAYKTTSTVALLVIVGVLPIHLLVRERAIAYGMNQNHKADERSMTNAKWQEETNIGLNG
ncbi:uncharacterized protein [Diabrotica undecimpunctata]|uniref:uncharacterized protein n=1 Tax=Diabrotica undecimpunctata TaxID=50387 RepID=UPI003B63E23A